MYIGTSGSTNWLTCLEVPWLMKWYPKEELRTLWGVGKKHL